MTEPLTPEEEPPRDTMFDLPEDTTFVALTCTRCRSFGKRRLVPSIDPRYPLAHCRKCGRLTPHVR